MFGLKKTSKVDEQFREPYESTFEPNNTELEKVRTEWYRKLEAAKAAIELPEFPFRIRKYVNTYNVYAPIDQWVCEQATVQGSSVYIPYGRRESVFDYAKEPEAVLEWVRIGPYVVINDGYFRDTSYYRAPAQPAMFSTYSEADNWLSNYLAPEEEETYFSAAGVKQTF